MKRLLDDTERRFVNDTITEEVSAWSSITGSFEAETTYGGPLDTSVNIEIKDLAITWKDREKLMRELADVVKKYVI